MRPGVKTCALGCRHRRQRFDASRINQPAAHSGRWSGPGPSLLRGLAFDRRLLANDRHDAARQPSGHPPFPIPSVKAPTCETAAAALPLVFHDRQAVIDRDPQALASRLAQHYALLDFGPRTSRCPAFMHRSSTATAGSLLLSCGYTSPIQGTVGERCGSGSINICFAGGSSYQLDGRILEISPQRPLFFAPGQEYRYSVDHFNGMAFDVELGRLQATAAAMAGQAVPPRRYGGNQLHPQVLSRGRQDSDALLDLLQRAFTLLDVQDSAAPLAGFWPHLPIDDLIYRTLCLLLFPRLAALLEDPDPGPTTRQRLLDELLEWILAHLDQPISLTQLEQRSGYSRRSLQVAFQQRFNCGPIQWIRRQRLEQARQALLRAEPEELVGAIASRFGYGSLTVFSREFRMTYGMRPSDLMRRARQRDD